MVRSLKGRRRPTAVGWLAAAALALIFVQVVVASADDANVGINNFAFTPAVLTVKPGAT